jgi:hypothetical protein
MVRRNQSDNLGEMRTPSLTKAADREGSEWAGAVGVSIPSARDP